MQHSLKLLAVCLLNMFVGVINAQSISGVVKNNNGNIGGATVTCNGATLTTDSSGAFSFSLPAGGVYTVQAQAQGTSVLQVVNLAAKQDYRLDLVFERKRTEIATLTVSGSRFAKRAAEEVVSIEVIKPDFARNASINTVDEVLDKLPGIDIIDNQINIRGGSGWSYGAGSRVLIMVDDMPMLSADANDAKWDFLPIENCEQIEVMKGAASALYGSSALNGVVNFRTAYATNKPITRVQMYQGLYGNPKRRETIWWNKQQPSFMGGYFSHAQKIKQLDVVVGSAWFSEDSYLQGDATRRIRLNSNLRYKPKQNAKLVLGVNTNVQVGKSSTFFLHAADTTFSKVLQPFGGIADSTTTNNQNQGARFNIDPYVTYTSSAGWQHNLRSRVFFAQNLIPEKKQSSTAYTVYGEYQVIKKTGAHKSLLWQNSNFIAGLANTLGFVNGELYGNHNYRNTAPYAQFEKKINKLWLLAGARLENNWLNAGFGSETKPVFRAGANYEPKFGTNIRASWGQGYRFASIAERFVNTNFGAASVFPNPNLLSETGWSAETGIKQALRVGQWLGYIDVAAFIMRYKNMMEFNFGYNPPVDSPVVGNPLDYIGFQSRNIGDAQISGLDFTTFLRYNRKKWRHNIIAGYTYMDPIALNPDSVVLANLSSDNLTLKYRFNHTIKGNWEGNLGRWQFACLNNINSPMVNIDEVFEFNSITKNPYGFIFEAGTQLPSTIRRYRKKYNRWTWTCDARVGYLIRKDIRASLIVKNIWNTEFYQRPALINPPRNFTLQISAEF